MSSGVLLKRTTFGARVRLRLKNEKTKKKKLLPHFRSSHFVCVCVFLGSVCSVSSSRVDRYSIRVSLLVLKTVAAVAPSSIPSLNLANPSSCGCGKAPRIVLRLQMERKFRGRGTRTFSFLTSVFFVVVFLFCFGQTSFKRTVECSFSPGVWDNEEAILSNPKATRGK